MRTLLPAALIVLLAAAGADAAGLPETINYQGRLTENTPSQTPIDTTVIMDFSLWDDVAAGTLLWSESGVPVTVTGGIFNVLLGASGTPLPASLFDSTELFLELTVAGETLSPRQRLSSVAFARRSGVADDAAALGGSPASAFQRAVSPTNCPAGSYFLQIRADGSASCGTPTDTGVTAVNPSGGITASVAGSTLNVSTDSTIQKRTTSPTCPSGQYLRSIASDGTPTCATDVGLGVPLQLSGSLANAVIDGTNTGTGEGVKGTSAGSAGVRGVHSPTGKSGSLGTALAGIYGQDPTNGGTAVYGDAGGLSGTTYGVYGSSVSPTGYGVYGWHGGGGWGVKGISSTGPGVEGQSTGGVGMQGISSTGSAIQGQSSSGHGIFGIRVADSNKGYVGTDAAGVLGQTTSGDPGVRGESNAVAGSGVGVLGTSASSAGTGVAGLAVGAGTGVSGSSSSGSGVAGTSATGSGVEGTVTSTTGLTIGVAGTSASSAGRGVSGLASSATGTTWGVYGEATSTSGRGVLGFVSASSGTTYGVWGEAASTSGRGVYGRTTATSGTTTGVYGESASTSGRGVYGRATATSGTAWGVLGESDSASGAGVRAIGSGASGVSLQVESGAIRVPGAGVGTSTTAYIHQPSGSDTGGDTTTLSHTLLNGNPDALVFASPVSVIPGSILNFPWSLYYDSGISRWRIRRLDLAPDGIPTNGARWHILIIVP